MPIVDYNPQNKEVLYVMGCAGLPWAAFSGDYATQKLTDKICPNYDEYLGATRKFFISSRLQKIFGKPISFALNNAYAKYRQVDKKGS